MELFTKADIPAADFKIDYLSRIAFIGSCFAENISKKFSEQKFHTLVNPLGTIYNPVSIENMAKKIAGVKNEPNKIYSNSDIFFDGESWCCWDAHSSLSVKGADCCGACVNGLNEAIVNAYKFLKTASAIFITLGTAYVYFLKETGKVVSNCHKQPANLFERRIISVDEAASALHKTIALLRAINPNIHIVFTVSPLRHLNDGAHGNNVSKATLLLAVEKVRHELTRETSDIVSYFPSYEIVMDELRDYRFYKSDMVHLSEVAENYIFERMASAYCDAATMVQMKRVEKFMKTVNHRIVNAGSTRTTEFAQQQIAAATELEKQINGLDLSEEIKYFKSLLF